MRQPYKEFDRSRLKIKPLAERAHDLTLENILPLAPVDEIPEALTAIAERIAMARMHGAAVILMMGAHVLRDGVQRYLIDLMEKGRITCIAMNGAGAIHDFEFALIGATTESVARYISEGQFGLWQETGRLNDIAAAAARNGQGLGEAVGRAITEENFPHRNISVLAAGVRLGLPVTVHSAIGQDIVHEHPNCDGAAWGAASYTDFLRFAAALETLEGGVIMNFGSAVMGPEVYLKALAMVRNVALQEGREVARFTSLVCDLRPLPDDVAQTPPKTHPDYYFRCWKTMLVRTVAGGGASFYVRDRHSRTIPALWTALREEILF